MEEFKNTFKASQRKSNEQIILCFARNTKFVAQIMAGALTSQKNEDKTVSIQVLSAIDQKIRAFETSFTEQQRSTMLQAQLAMLEECKTYDEFVDRISQASARSKNCTLHP